MGGWIQFSLTDTKTVQHEAKKKKEKEKQFTTTGKEGIKEKKILRTASEREEKMLEDLICFLFVNWKKKNKKL